MYSSWKTNDEGEDCTLYTGLDIDGITVRYFLIHFRRDWNGGWSHEETKEWYELSEEVYFQLCDITNNQPKQ